MRLYFCCCTSRQVKDTSGAQWFHMEAPTLTTEIKADLKVIALRSILDPKRHYKKDKSLMKFPKYFQMGTVCETLMNFFIISSSSAIQSHMPLPYPYHHQHATYTHKHIFMSSRLLISLFSVSDCPLMCLIFLYPLPLLFSFFLISRSHHLFVLEKIKKVIAGPADTYAARLPKTQRQPTIVDEILSNEHNRQYVLSFLLCIS
jgi:hypothetical protein